MGRRGIDRPILRAKDSPLDFEWPMGTSEYDRKRILGYAREACPEGPARHVRIVFWLQKNAWVAMSGPLKKGKRGA